MVKNDEASLIVNNTNRDLISLQLDVTNISNMQGGSLDGYGLPLNKKRKSKLSVNYIKRIKNFNNW